jgi:hypothetical protein
MLVIHSLGYKSLLEFSKVTTAINVTIAITEAIAVAKLGALAPQTGIFYEPKVPKFS